MPDLNSIYDALRKAHAAGDTASARRLAEYIQSVTEPQIEEPEKPLAGFMGSYKEAVSQLKDIGPAAARYATTESPEDRAALLKAAESKYKQMDFEHADTLSDKWEAFKELAGGSLGQWTAPLVAGSVAGAESLPTGVAAPFIGLGTAAAVGTAQYAAQNILRTAQEQQKAIDEGRTPNPLELGKMFTASAGEAALDALDVGYFKKLFKMFPGMGHLLGEGGEKLAENEAKKLVQAHEAGKLSYTKKAGIEIVKGAGFEMPQEVAQQALERWQAGLSLTDDDALSEYKQAAIGAAILGGAAGGVKGVLETATKKAAERLATEQQEAALADQAAPIVKEASKEEAEPTTQAQEPAAPIAPVEIAKSTEEAAPAPVVQEQAKSAKTAQPEEAVVSEQTAIEKPVEIKAAEEMLARVDAGGIPLAAAKLRKLAEDLGLEVKSSAKPVDTISRIRDAVNQANSAAAQATAAVETAATTSPATAEKRPEIVAAEELLTKIDAGNYILKAPVVRKVAEGLGITVEKGAKPLDTVSKIREVVNQINEAAPITEPTTQETVPEVAQEATQEVAPIEEVQAISSAPTSAPVADAAATSAQTGTAVPAPAPVPPASPAPAAPAPAAPEAAAPAAPAKPVSYPEPTPEHLAAYEDVVKAQRTAAQVKKQAAPTAAPAPAKTSVAEAASDPAASKQIVSTAKSIIDSVPIMDSKAGNWMLGELSKLPDSAHKMIMPLMSMHHLTQTFRSKLPSIATVEQVLEDYLYKATQRKIKIDNNVSRWTDVMRDKKNARYLDTLNDLVINSTLTQIDPETGEFLTAVDPDTKAELEPVGKQMVAAWKTLPEDVKQVYRELKAAYKGYHEDYLNALKANMSKSTFEALRKTIETEALGIYFPLFRKGDYWVSYINSNGSEVVRAFTNPRDREIAIAEAKRLGAKDERRYAKIREMREGRPPTGAYAEILDVLKKEGASNETLDSVYEAYLKFLPSNSIRQQFRARRRDGGLFGVLGAEKDALTVYATMAPRLTNAITKLEHMPTIDKAKSEVDAEALQGGVKKQGEPDTYVNPNVLVSAAESTAKHIDAVVNPKISKIGSTINTWTYFNTLIANPSSALINLTQLPTVVYPLLAGKYGVGKAYAALKQSTGDYVRRGGKDNNSVYMPDHTAFVGPNGKPLLDLNGNPAAGLNQKDQQFAKLYKELMDRGALLPSNNIDLGERQKSSTSDYTGKWAKASHKMNWLFQNSERANREITAIAAFNLALSHNNGDVDAAIKEAVNAVKDSHGVGHAALGPTLFQSGFGRVIGLYKRFALNQIYLVSRLFKEAYKSSDPEVRRVAKRQLVGVYLMTGAFAGVQGMPLVGVGMVLSRLLHDMFGDEDEPYDPDAEMRDALGDLGYKGAFNKAFMVDVASRTGFSGLLWKDDPKRISEVGLPMFVMEQMIGPSMGVMKNYQLAFKQFKEGDYERAVETSLPVTPRNLLKGIRYGTEGAKTKDGVPIVQDINAYEAFMQVLGFNPVSISEARARAGTMKMMDKHITERKTALYDQFYAARMADDFRGMNEVKQKMAVFNQKFPQYQIRPDDIITSIRSRIKKLDESVDGVRLNNKLRMYLIQHSGAPPETEED